LKNRLSPGAVTKQMKSEIPMEQLLRWRLSQAEAGAPPAPPSAHLLELARPWWETRPEQFRSLIERLGRIQAASEDDMAESHQSSGGYPVPALIAFAKQEIEACVRILHLDVRDGRLLLRFQLDAVAAQAPEHLELTLIADPSARPLLSALATLSADAEYRVEAGLPVELAQAWRQLKAADRMPFRLLLRSGHQITPPVTGSHAS
jgi:hypothetical protein